MKNTIIKITMAVAIMISVFATGYGVAKQTIEPEVETVYVSDYDLALVYAQDEYWWSDDYSIIMTDSTDTKMIGYEAVDSNGNGKMYCEVNRSFAMQHYINVQSGEL